LRKLIGTGDSQVRLRRFNATGRHPQVVVLFEGGSDKALQFLISKNLPPSEIRQ
jgi:hypothetical protein